MQVAACTMTSRDLHRHVQTLSTDRPLRPSGGECDLLQDLLHLTHQRCVCYSELLAIACPARQQEGHTSQLDRSIVVRCAPLRRLLALFCRGSRFMSADRAAVSGISQCPCSAPQPLQGLPQSQSWSRCLLSTAPAPCRSRRSACAQRGHRAEPRVLLHTRRRRGRRQWATPPRRSRLLSPRGAACLWRCTATSPASCRPPR